MNDTATLDLLAMLESPEQREIRLHPDLFAPDFLDWFAANSTIWTMFVAQADAIWRSGRKYYSARTIIHWIRHETALRESVTGDGFKINNNWSADLARLYLIVRPDRPDFFELRHQLQSSKRAA